MQSVTKSRDFHAGGGPFDLVRGRLLFMDFAEPDDKLIRLLLPRLERISVDSYWAHRASGVRGALVRLLAQMEAGETIDPESLRANLGIGFEILQEAAQEY